MATLSNTPWWFIRSFSTSGHQGVVWIQSFPLLGHSPATGKASRLAAAMPGSSVRSCLLVILSQPIHVYTHAHTRTYTCMHIYTYTRSHTYIHIYRSSGYLPPADAPHRRCKLPAQTFNLWNHKSSLKLRIFQQPGYQDQVVDHRLHSLSPQIKFQLQYIQRIIFAFHDFLQWILYNNYRSV